MKLKQFGSWWQNISDSKQIIDLKYVFGDTLPEYVDVMPLVVIDGMPWFYPKEMRSEAIDIHVAHVSTTDLNRQICFVNHNAIKNKTISVHSFHLKTHTGNVNL